MKSNSLTLASLCVGRDGAPLFAPLDVQLAAGEIAVVQAPNGFGKSSLLKCIAGLLRPLHGKVLWNGVPFHRHADYPATCLYMGHRRGLEPSRTVGSFVRFWADTYHQSELIDAALHYFDLEDTRDTPLYQLSAGWQQRVALTRLITQPSALWLLDEPTTHLDDNGLALLHGLLQTRSEQGGIVVMASHLPLQGERVRRIDLTPDHESLTA